MSWPWIALLVAAVVLVVAVEWPRLLAVAGSDARRKRERARRKATLRVVSDEHDEKAEFAASVQRDLDRLPTIEERGSGRPK